MAFKLEILTPQKTFYEGELVSLVAPGVEGYFGVLTSHAPIVACSEGGKVSVKETSENKRSFQVGPGIVEVYRNRAVILTKKAKESVPC